MHTMKVCGGNGPKSVQNLILATTYENVVSMMHRCIFHGENLLQGPHRGLDCVEMRRISIFILDASLCWMS